MTHMTVGPWLYIAVKPIEQKSFILNNLIFILFISFENFIVPHPRDPISFPWQMNLPYSQKRVRP